VNRSEVLVTSGRTDSGAWLVAAVVCLAVAIGGVFVDPVAGWQGLLIAAYVGLSAALGATLFVAINRVTGAKWAHGIHRVPWAVGRLMPVPAAFLAVVLPLGLTALYPWAVPGAAEASHLIHEKAAWLNVPFFLGRAGAVLAGFWVLTAMLLPRPEPAAAEPRMPSTPAAVIFVLLFAVLISVSSWDWMMSLEPEWFSTMFGVYGFAGTFLSGIAVVTVVAVIWSRAGEKRIALGDRQAHDLGALLFGFSMFWGYIWFCQYMLIWYANVPEETPYFAHRLSHGWEMLFWLNPVVNFVIPFVALLRKPAKLNRSVLLQVGIIVLVGRWLDAYLMVAPSQGGSPTLPVFALAATVVVGVAMLVVGRRNQLR